MVMHVVSGFLDVGFTSVNHIKISHHACGVVF
jgi:hypothetical protein